MQETFEKIAVTPAAKNRDYAKFLKNMPIFMNFSKPAIGELLTHSRVKKYSKGTIIFMTGDKAEYFNIIMNGWVKLYRDTRGGRESVISVLTNGEVFGKTAVLNKGFCAYNVEAIISTSLLLIPAVFMLHMAEHNEEFEHFLANFLESELKETRQQDLHAEHLAQMTSAQRVACFLLRLCIGKKQGAAVLHLPYEKSLVAGKLGMTSETFSRALNQLMTQGVETNNSIITIHNITQLRSYTCNSCSATTMECHLGTEIEEI